MVGTIDCII